MQTPRPLALIAELTYRCPLRCPYCSNPLELHRYRNEVDTATWKRALQEASELGVVQVHFSGGEPLVRRDVVELVEEADRLGLYSHMSTGGTPATELLLRRLQDAGLNALQISLLDSHAANNDFLAGARSFDKKQCSVAAAKAAGFYVTLNVVLHRHNLDRIEQIIELAAAWQVDKLELAHVQYSGWAFRNRHYLQPTRVQLENAARVVEQARERLGGRVEIVHVLPELDQEYPEACLHGWGRVFLTIAPDGAVLPCQTAREISGLEFPNIHDQSLEQIWFHSPVFQRFRGTAWMPEPCRTCPRREIDHGGCRCRAFLITGDASVTDPTCRLSPHRAMAEHLFVPPTDSETDFAYRSIIRQPARS